MKIRVDAAAKINLFLDIMAKLDNGYHSLFSIMQSVGLYDTVTLERNRHGKILISCTESTLPVDKTNIAHKAASAFFDAMNMQDRGVTIHIEKRIPLAAGLAGGSADAAAVIAGLNKLFTCALSEDRLCAIALSVGSDVPFCLTGGTMLVQDIGGILSRLPALPPCTIVLVKPESGISTIEAYKAYDDHNNIRHLDTTHMLNETVRGKLKGICSLAGNVFEQCIEVPERVEIKAIMRKHGVLCSQMSGSGPTVFGIFERSDHAQECAAELKESFKDVFVCEPVSNGLKTVESEATDKK
ncbi:MAG TPA: 4-(cytidine 5'-diphospho)-2-C-methyl-D-erythritol kinase [Clostridia bacterium]|nr:4-(cytidine 5'-diphospho)-2-C-methyl-D-erythritol kinase [Clostridia bacterium]